MFSDFEGQIWLYLKITFVPDRTKQSLRLMTYTFLLLSLQVFIGEKRVKALLGAVVKVIKKSNAKSSVFKFEI